jgi:hypothetical protein
MGARVNFIFQQTDGNAVGLYSHWGEDSWAMDLAQALKHAAVRKNDESYYIRMALSYLMQDSILDETGFGIYAMEPNDSSAMFMDHPIFINLKDDTITDETGTHSIDSFVEYHTININV